jgi:hypothetical protein
VSEIEPYLDIVTNGQAYQGEMQCNPAIERKPETAMDVTQSASLHRPRPILHPEYHKVTYLVLP